MTNNIDSIDMNEALLLAIQQYNHEKNKYLKARLAIDLIIAFCEDPDPYWLNTNLNDIQGEIWKAWDHKDYAGFVQVSTLGRVRTVARYIRDRNGFLKPISPCVIVGFFNSYGYRCVTLCKNNRTKEFKVHRMIADCFLPAETEKLTDVNHINGLKPDNRLANLERCTRSHNIAHAWKLRVNKGYVTPGEHRYNAKLNNEIVNSIWKLRKSGYGPKAISQSLSIKVGLIKNVLYRNGWKHLKPIDNGKY